MKRAVKLVIVLCIIFLMALSIILILPNNSSEGQPNNPTDIHNAAKFVETNYEENSHKIVELNKDKSDFELNIKSTKNLSNNSIVEIVSSLIGLIIGLFYSTSIFYKIGKKDLFN